MESKLTRWIKRVKDTQVDEINCSECLDQVSQYVDMELASGDAGEQMPKLKQHLDQCPACHEEYVVLRDLARLDAEGDLLASEELAEQLKKLKK